MSKQTSSMLGRTWSYWMSVPLWLQILVGMVLGITVGVVLGEQATVLKPIGTLFVNIIKMLIVPLVFCSLIVGVTSMEDTAKMGRIGFKSFTFYLCTTAIAISIGLAVGYVIQPGAGLDLPLPSGVSDVAKEVPSVMQTLIDIVPTNPIAALANGQILQVIVFAVALGIALVLIGDHGKPAIKVFESLAEAMYKLTDMVMKLAPYGVFGLMAWVAGAYGIEMLLPLLKVIVAVYVGCIIHVLGFYSIVLSMFSKLNPLHFFKGISNAMAVAFTTSSSAGTLPASMKCASEYLGVNKKISSFVLPLGTTINMDGTALYQGVTALFVAQAFGIDLTWVDYLTIILTATLASIGTAGVPGAGLVMLTLVLSTVGLPLEGVALIAGIDRILDMARTVVNVSGDLVATTVIAKSEDELDMEHYNADMVQSAVLAEQNIALETAAEQSAKV
ncbi:dicarboxylate/amino acid:cation symporter [Shewanella sp. SP2S2-4]|uniref:Dicarboxylate/amino acid:cation symporter n=1 Tax=Shewanella scandinavica TaxID=3063538 RepID=A0ABU3G121_9GAMM|nr:MULTISPECIES: dicarboxylate/amino acid:cation symporter [Shewanella]MBU1391877.1 dicarboxylate/amino acid:cation symporter [Gammaproteobacteria bacterium]QYX63995.1 dicarboxylate/amino acid:cation symporter [Shewanella putrefaciens]AUD61638.1 sodium:dicarboxylate symporter [Shewanella sp. Pdp11]MBU1476573.1 dicarboxylate/amino acid:cation symporter [Gammaproteobacteria bacterium]MBU2000055.1 dicarboxylate/amino acid:cation symporter [Gammaproteobacteria bacterium]